MGSGAHAGLAIEVSDDPGALPVRYERKAAIAPSIGLTFKALPIVCSACPVLATWGIGPWVSRCLTLVGNTFAPGKEELASHYPRCLRGI